MRPRKKRKGSKKPTSTKPQKKAEVGYTDMVVALVKCWNCREVSNPMLLTGAPFTCASCGKFLFSRKDPKE